MSNEELDLLNEMKENCLKKGQYIDEKAKDKFNMLCHCEDFIIENYEQSKEIERLNNIIEEVEKFVEEVLSSTKGVVNDYMYHEQHNKERIELLKEDIEIYTHILDILKGEDKE